MGKKKGNYTGIGLSMNTFISLRVIISSGKSCLLIKNTFFFFQVMGLAALGISASMLTSATSKEDEKLIYKNLEKGEGSMKILYVTPEKVSKSKRFMSKLEKCYHAGRLSLIAIDVSISINSRISSFSTYVKFPKTIPFRLELIFLLSWYSHFNE